jgi:hypothetical protein
MESARDAGKPGSRPARVHLGGEPLRSPRHILAVDATVVDEGRTFEGLAAITAWKIEVKRKCADTVEPLKGVSRHSCVRPG